MPSQSLPFPFIVGCGRSGTTLLRVILEGDPNFAIPPESYFPIRLLDTDRRRERGPVDVERLLADLAVTDHFQSWLLDPERVSGCLRDGGALEWPDCMRRLYALYAESQGKTRYGDKTPWFVLYIPLLSQMFPESRFLHMIRDGRDVALAVREMSWGPTEMPRLADFWARRVRLGKTAGERLGPARYQELRYEDLLDDPEGSVRDLCAFFDLEFSPEMLRYHDRKVDSLGVTDPSKHMNLTRPLQRGLRNWRTQMSRSDLIAFEVIAGRELERFGYGREAPTAPAAFRLRTRAGIASLETKKRLWRRAEKAKRLARRLTGQHHDVPTP